jgi:hypothetical protein
MNTPAIVPTITQRVRTFLAGQGAALRPWTGLEETYDEFYALLRRRRNDPEFWRPLKGLLRDVVESAVDSQKSRRPLTAHRELLSAWKVDELVDELRDALLAGGNSAGPARRDFTRRLSSAVLGGFLLLGLAAAGCGNDSNPDLATEAGVAAACTSTVATELDQAIGESSLSASVKSDLCQCFASLSTSWTTSLTQLFATGTPEEISNMLENLTACCQPTGIMTRDGLNAGPTSTDLQYVKNGPGYMICAVPVYKGVSFPD